MPEFKSLFSVNIAGKICVVLLAFLCPSLAAQELKEDSFTDCIDLKKFTHLDFTAMPGTPTTRKLGSKADADTVTIREAYRIRYEYKGLKFLDLKIEYPVEGNYESDRQKLSDFFKYLGEVGSETDKLSHFDDLMGYEAYILDRYQPLSSYYTLSSNILFDNENQRFIYLYYWNINREKTIFKTINDFLDVKAMSFEQIIHCIK